MLPAGMVSRFPMDKVQSYLVQVNVPGTGGHYSPLFDPGTHYFSFPSIIFVRSLGLYAMAYHERLGDTESQIEMRTSSDLIRWSPPIASATIHQAGRNLFYPTLVGETSDPTISDGKSDLPLIVPVILLVGTNHEPEA